MAKRKRLIPFSWRNIFNGLAGKSYERAEAEYYYEGEELERKLAEIDYANEQEKALRLLEIEHKYGHIQGDEYDKKRATLRQEPWVKADLVPDPVNPLSGFFNIDWNEFFIRELEKRGYQGGTDEEILDKWLRALHANQLYETGVVDPNPDDNSEVIREELDNGRASYS